MVKVFESGQLLAKLWAKEYTVMAPFWTTVANHVFLCATC